jgi:hypothetical protein
LTFRNERRDQVLRFRIAALAGVLVIGAVGAGLTAASAATVAHVQNKPTKGEQSLANHVPSSYANTCVGFTASTKKTDAKFFPKVKKQINQIVAAIQCKPTGASVPEVVIFTQWKNVADMNAWYQANVVDLGIQPEQGAADQATCPREKSYSSGAGTTDAGRSVCTPGSPNPPAEIVWTATSLKISGDADLHNDPDGSVLTGWWKGDSGPV